MMFCYYLQGTFLTRVHAEDQDKGINTPVHYYIEEGRQFFFLCENFKSTCFYKKHFFKKRIYKKPTYIFMRNLLKKLSIIFLRLK